MALDTMVDSLRAAGEPTRLRILALLRAGELAVGELAQLLGQSQPRLSHHLKTLSGAGLVERLPEGAWVFYRLSSEPPARALLEAVFDGLDLSAGEFARDAAQLETVRAARVAAAEAYFGRVAETWDTVRSLHYPNEAIEAALLDAAGGGPFDRLVDIGTGTGRMLTLFSPLARRAEGIDLSHQMLTVARANLSKDGVDNARVRQGEAGATPFDDASADLVIIHQVLHFVDDPARVIAEAARIMAPGGRLLVVDFAPHDLEFLRAQHGHRRLGVRQDAMAAWAGEAGLTLGDPRRFDPPKDNPHGLAVLIWAADKPAAAQEKAA
ncbi:MAG: metalloregulator ArsR/SmtB family transcription factor [Pseudomonadota bacterium]